MGCAPSTELWYCAYCDEEQRLRGSSRFTLKQLSGITEKELHLLQTTKSFNEFEVDLSHFLVTSRILGIGGFGMVRTTVKLTGADKSVAYALKSLSKHAILQRATGIAAVMNELKSLALLVDSKFICRVHYAFQDSAFLFMILDLAPGGDMRYNMRAMSGSRFPEDAARFYIAQVILAVEHCHEASILHRDVKPENLLMKENGYIVLSDFGVAKILPDINDCRSTSGTHGYMAPEIYIPQHIHGPPADWFAVGITLHEFVTGRRPFEASRLQAFRNGGPQSDRLYPGYLYRCSFLSNTCKDFIAALLDPRPLRRLGSHNGAAELKQHSWLRDIDWLGLDSFTLAAPYRPGLVGLSTEIKQDDLFRAAQKHMESPAVLVEDQDKFERYEYRTKFYSCTTTASASRTTRPSTSLTTELTDGGRGAQSPHSRRYRPQSQSIPKGEPPSGGVLSLLGLRSSSAGAARGVGGGDAVGEEKVCDGDILDTFSSPISSGAQVRSPHSPLIQQQHQQQGGINRGGRRQQGDSNSYYDGRRRGQAYLPASPDPLDRGDGWEQFPTSGKYQPSSPMSGDTAQGVHAVQSPFPHHQRGGGGGGADRRPLIRRGSSSGAEEVKDDDAEDDSRAYRDDRDKDRGEDRSQQDRSSRPVAAAASATASRAIAACAQRMVSAFLSSISLGNSHHHHHHQSGRDHSTSAGAGAAAASASASASVSGRPGSGRSIDRCSSFSLSSARSLNRPGKQTSGFAIVPDGSRNSSNRDIGRSEITVPSIREKSCISPRCKSPRDGNGAAVRNVQPGGGKQSPPRVVAFGGLSSPEEEVERRSSHYGRDRDNAHGHGHSHNDTAAVAAAGGGREEGREGGREGGPIINSPSSQHNGTISSMPLPSTSNEPLSWLRKEDCDHLILLAAPRIAATAPLSQPHESASPRSPTSNVNINSNSRAVSTTTAVAEHAAPCSTEIRPPVVKYEMSQAVAVSSSVDPPSCASSPRVVEAASSPSPSSADKGGGGSDGGGSIVASTIANVTGSTVRAEEKSEEGESKPRQRGSTTAAECAGQQYGHAATAASEPVLVSGELYRWVRGAGLLGPSTEEDTLASERAPPHRHSSTGTSRRRPSDDIATIGDDDQEMSGGGYRYANNTLCAEIPRGDLHPDYEALKVVTATGVPAGGGLGRHSGGSYPPAYGDHYYHENQRQQQQGSIHDAATSDLDCSRGSSCDVIRVAAGKEVVAPRSSYDNNQQQEEEEEEQQQQQLYDPYDIRSPPVDPLHRNDLQRVVCNHHIPATATATATIAAGGGGRADGPYRSASKIPMLRPSAAAVRSSSSFFTPPTTEMSPQSQSQTAQAVARSRTEVDKSDTATAGLASLCDSPYTSTTIGDPGDPGDPCDPIVSVQSPSLSPSPSLVPTTPPMIIPPFHRPSSVETLLSAIASEPSSPLPSPLLIDHRPWMVRAASTGSDAGTENYQQQCANCHTRLSPRHTEKSLPAGNNRTRRLGACVNCGFVGVGMGVGGADVVGAQHMTMRVLQVPARTELAALEAQRLNDEGIAANWDRHLLSSSSIVSPDILPAGAVAGSMSGARSCSSSSLCNVPVAANHPHPNTINIYEDEADTEAAVPIAATAGVDSVIIADEVRPSSTIPVIAATATPAASAVATVPVATEIAIAAAVPGNGAGTGPTELTNGTVDGASGDDDTFIGSTHSSGRSSAGTGSSIVSAEGTSVTAPVSESESESVSSLSGGGDSLTLEGPSASALASVAVIAERGAIVLNSIGGSGYRAIAPDSSTGTAAAAIPYNNNNFEDSVNDSVSDSEGASGVASPSPSPSQSTSNDSMNINSEGAVNSSNSGY